MNQTVTYLNDPSEPALFFSSAIENYTFDYFFGSFPIDSSPTEDVDNLSEINNCTVVPFSGDIVDNVYNVDINFRLYLSSWIMFFDGSKSKDGDDVGFVLIDLKGTKLMISFRIEFECINNIAEYEALVRGLRKMIDLGAQVIECYGDYKIIVK